MRYGNGMEENSSQAQEFPDVASGQGQAHGIYVIGAHPDWRNSKVNRRLFSQVQALVKAGPSGSPAAGPRIDVNDLYGSYPDYFIDIATEQRRLAAAQLVVLMHPIQWYSMPALQKLWLDEVLTYGWAYGAGADEAEQPRGARSIGARLDAAGAHGRALQGKDLWLVATTGGSEDAYHPQGYNRYFFEAFLPPYEQTAALCGMRFLPPLLLYGAHSRTVAEVDAHVEVFTQRLQSYPNWPEMDEIETCPSCEVPLTARPAAPVAAPA